MPPPPVTSAEIRSTLGVSLVELREHYRGKRMNARFVNVLREFRRRGCGEDVDLKLLDEIIAEHTEN